jgi:hypothetical protein
MNTVKGIIGGIIGGLIASIPWILLAVYTRFMIAYLAFLIGLGVNYGYRLFGGKVNKALPFIIAIVSVVIVVFATVALIPLLMYAKEGYGFDFYNLTLFYRNSDVVSSLLVDTGIAVLFTFLGIVGLLKDISNEAKTQKIVLDFDDDAVIDIDEKEE